MVEVTDLTVQAGAQLEEPFFLSFLGKAEAMGLLTKQEAADNRLACMRLLARQASAYTKGKSSSLQKETVQSILDSSLYILAMPLRPLPDITAMAERLRADGTDHLFSQGQSILKRQLSICRMLHRAVKNSMVPVDLYAYQEAVLSGIGKFFASYDPEFQAQETPGDISYPLAGGPSVLTGVLFIRNYLERLLMENRFCRCFYPGSILGVLNGYDTGYPFLLLNLFTQVLQNALGCVLAGKDVRRLTLTEDDRAFLTKRLANKSPAELGECLTAACHSLCPVLHINDPRLATYMDVTATGLAIPLKIALDAHNLRDFFVTPIPRHPL